MDNALGPAASGSQLTLLLVVAAILLRPDARAVMWPASVETPAPVRGVSAGPVPERLCFAGVEAIIVAGRAHRATARAAWH